jgi:type VI secretion system secreted protein VgrG
MAVFNQDNAAFTVLTPLGQDALVLLAFRGEETLSGSFEFVLELGALHGTKVDSNALVGQVATLTLRDQGETRRTIHGLVCEFTDLGPGRQLDLYRMVLRPRLWQLGLVRRSRVFQNQTALQILQSVCQPVGGCDQSWVSPQPNERVYCAQYRETDLDFFTRICTEEGLQWFWQHSENDHLLTVSSGTSQPDSGVCLFDRDEGGSADRACIRQWEVSQAIVNNRVSLLDSHFELYNQPLSSSRQGLESVSAGEAAYRTISGAIPASQENAQSPARYFDSVSASGSVSPQNLEPIYDAVENRARLLAQAATGRCVVARGRGTVMHLVPGHAFTLQGRQPYDGPWRTLSVRHEGRQEGLFWQGETPKVSYRCEFEAAPLSVPQRPWPPVPRPVAASVETAIVVGPPGQEANLDCFGRVQVRFWWQPAGDETQPSCWIRVAQFWAGQSYGAFFWPRCGHEVVVAHEHGDPDRPIIVGSVYNSVNTVPYSMPGNTYIAGLRTKTQGGDAAENCHKFTLSDVPGSEIINLHAESMLITNQEKRQFSLRSTSSTNIN